MDYAEPIVPAYQGPLLTVHQWQQPLKTGGSVTFERCTRPDTVAVLAFLDTNTVLLTQELPIGQKTPFLDAPGGRVDSGETHEEAARRELREETGYTAADFFLWTTNTYNGLIQFKQSLFLAKGVEKAREPGTTHDLTEEITLLTCSFDELYAFSLANRLRRSELMLAVLRMRHDPESHQRLIEFLKDA